jgi:hypothetical protein
MIITRNRPNTHKIESTIFHPGAQFIEDEIYIGIPANKEKGVVAIRGLKDNPEMQEQLKAGFMTIDLPAGNAKGKKTIADVIATLDDKKAIEIAIKVCDYLDLDDIAKMDTRRSVRDAAEKQKVERQETLNGMAPKFKPSTGGMNGDILGYNRETDWKKEQLV